MNFSTGKEFFILYGRRFFISPLQSGGVFMNTKYLIFSSVTYALRSMTLLKRYGIYSRLEKIKNIQALGGCGYALAVDASMLDSAAGIISGEGIRIIDILDYK